MRRLLIQGAHAVLRMGRATTLGQWGWQHFARKGGRNIAMAAAIARKMLVQVWDTPMGSDPKDIRDGKSFDRKLTKPIVLLGKTLRTELGLAGTAKDCITNFKNQLLVESAKKNPPCKENT